MFYKFFVFVFILAAFAPTASAATYTALIGKKRAELTVQVYSCGSGLCVRHAVDGEVNVLGKPLKIDNLVVRAQATGSTISYSLEYNGTSFTIVGRIEGSTLTLKAFKNVMGIAVKLDELQMIEA